jgi:hypothetical protein
VGRSEAACRQLAVRARRHVAAGRPRFEADRKEREKLAARSFSALRDGDVDNLRALLAADVQLVGDGVGKAPTFARAIIGPDKVARVLAAMFPVLVRIEVPMEPREVNGQPGAIIRDRESKVLFTLALDVLDGQIQTIRSVSNPDADTGTREASAQATGFTRKTHGLGRVLSLSLCAPGARPRVFHYARALLSPLTVVANICAGSLPAGCSNTAMNPPGVVARPSYSPRK